MSLDGGSGVRGTLNCAYFPTDETGEGEPDEDLLPDEPEDLLGKAVTFRVDIDSAANLPKDLCKNVFVAYNLNLDRNRTFQTEESTTKTQNPSFKFKQVHHIDAMTPSLLRYLTNGQLCFKVYGYPDFEMARKMNKKDIEESKKQETKKDAVKQQQAAKVEKEMIKAGTIAK